MTSSESGVFSSEIEIEVRAQIRRLIRHAEPYYVNEPEIVKYSHVHRMVQEWFEGALAAELSADGTLPDAHPPGSGGRSGHEGDDDSG